MCSIFHVVNWGIGNKYRRSSFSFYSPKHKAIIYSLVKLLFCQDCYTRKQLISWESNSHNMLSLILTWLPSSLESFHSPLSIPKLPFLSLALATTYNSNSYLLLGSNLFIYLLLISFHKFPSYWNQNGWKKYAHVFSTKISFIESLKSLEKLCIM